MASSEGPQSLANLVSYFSDSDEEIIKDEDGMEGVEEEEVNETEKEMEKEQEQAGKAEKVLPDFLDTASVHSIKSVSSLVSYGVPEEERAAKRTTGLVSYDGDDDDGKKADESLEIDDHDESWLDHQPSPGDDLIDRVTVDNVKHVDGANLTASMSLPESALSQKIRRLSADEVRLPPEPQGKCPRHLQEKIASYYNKNLNLNQVIQRRKDFRNPSIYEKLINYLGVDELGTNYPKDMYDPYSWDESSYYEALAKTQRDEIQKRKEKNKTEKTKVEFVTGVVRKAQVQAPQVTSTTGLAASSSGLLGTGHEEKKRKSKWDNPAPQQMPPPVPLMSLPRPIISLVTTTIPTATVVSTSTSATGSKTTVISSIGTIKKPKVEK